LRQSAFCLPPVCFAVALSAANLACAQAEPAFELHDWSAWLADPTLEHAGAKDHFFSAMPGVVDSTRFRRGGRGPESPEPLGMLTFYGDAVEDIEIDFRVDDGRFMAHWPAASAKSNRLRWIETALIEQVEDAAQLAFVSEDHWFQQARQGDALYVRSDARTERFIAYDTELQYTVPIKLAGGPDVYQVQNIGPAPLKDLFICLPTPEGRRVGWLDELPAGEHAAESAAPPAGTEKPADEQPSTAAPPTLEFFFQPAAIECGEEADFAFQGFIDLPADAAQSEPVDSGVGNEPESQPDVAAGPEVRIDMSAPLAEDSPRLTELTESEMARRLLATGLNQHEVDLILARYAQAMFHSEEMVVVFRYDAATVEGRMPLVTYPEPARTVRVALVIARNIDPQIGDDIRNLVQQLGHPKYAQRQSAHERLAELGRLAIPVLRAALKHSDPEVVYRAERLLLAQNESIDAN
jgi:hypothetical protein